MSGYGADWSDSELALELEDMRATVPAVLEHLERERLELERRRASSREVYGLDHWPAQSVEWVRAQASEVDRLEHRLGEAREVLRELEAETERRASVRGVTGCIGHPSD